MMATEATQLTLEGDEQQISTIRREGNLLKAFIVPPFSVLDTRQGYWRERKRAWLSLGIQSELGRGDVMPSGASSVYSGASPRAGLRGGKRGPARCFGQDIMRGEWKSKAQRERSSAFKSQGRQTALRKGVSPGINSIYGRAVDAGTTASVTGTSIFDPVLCECMYSWFCPSRCRVLDPFAGGSVRGIVADLLGLDYTGIELRPEQVLANQQQWEAICSGSLGNATWLVGDSAQVIPDHYETYDFLFSCPPYYDLEVYSDLPGELSAMRTYGDFLDAYGRIIRDATGRLNNNRFAAFVVSNIRDSKGIYHNLVGDTVRLFKQAGLHFYNDAVLLNAIGSLPIRVGRQFAAGRKLGKTHQNVLVFVKGDWRKAAKTCNGDKEIPPLPGLIQQRQ